ncbi:hypothetical protein ACFL5V_10800 [Fibrobacterota bacterium]
MKRVFLTIIIGFGGIALWLLYSSQAYRIHSSSEVQDLKTALDLQSDSIALLDMDISRLLRTSSGTKIASAELDSLSSVQRALQERYDAVRKELAAAIDSKQNFNIKRIVLAFIHKIGWVYSGLGLLVLAGILLLILVRKNLFRASSRQAPVSPAPKQLRKKGDSSPDMSSNFQQAVRDIAAITRNNRLDGTSPGYGNTEGIETSVRVQRPAHYPGKKTAEEELKIKGTQRMDIPEVSVPVSHLDKGTTDGSGAGEGELDTSLPILESRSESGKVLAENDDISNDGHAKDTNGSQGQTWDRYERESHQKAAVVKLARRGSTSSEISKRLKISQDEVELVIRASRESV